VNAGRTGLEKRCRPCVRLLRL